MPASWAAALVLALGLLAFNAPDAGAHAQMRSSDPPAGARLESAPREVAVTFTEAPDPKLSSIQLLDRSGGRLEAGRAEAAPGRPDTLVVPVKDLPEGSYSVSWRVISRVDGHTTAGAFAFGVRAEPGAPVKPAPRSQAAPLSVGGRLALYAGLSALLGISLVGGFAFDPPRTALLRWVAPAWGLALAGAGAVAAAQLRETGAAPGDLLESSLGRALALRLAPLLAGAPVYAVLRRAGRERAVFAAVGIAAAGAMATHVAFGHAAAGSLAVVKAGVQWVHFVAAAVWIGGLMALLAGVRGEPDASRAAAVRRFSGWAAVALGAVAFTGVFRAYEAVGSLKALTGTPYGRTVMVKSGLLLVLAAMGGVNRFRNVAASRLSLRGLRGVGGAEIGVGLASMAAAAFLAVTPPAGTASGGDRGPLLATGSDFGTTVRASLEISPGFPGLNAYRLELEDFDTKEVIDAGRVTLRFVSAALPEAGESEVVLVEAGKGRFEASGGELAFPGRWTMTVTLERGARSVEVPLKAAVPSGEIAVTEGEPRIHDVALGSGRSLQLYVDPRRPGKSELHVTYSGQDGRELDVAGAAISAMLPGGETRSLEARRFGPGHFVATVQLRKGEWSFEVVATVGEDRLVSLVPVLVGRG